MERITIVRDARGEHRVAQGKDRSVVDGVEVRLHIRSNGEVRLGDDGSRVAWVAVAGDVRWIFLDGRVYELEIEPRGGRRRTASGHASLAAPMPATVVRVDVEVGTSVRRGDTLVILEAMKMELPIRAASDGTVTSVSCKPGDLVQPGVPLLEIE